MAPAYFIFGVLGFLGALSAIAGCLMSRAAVQSTSQREHLRQFWATLAIAFMVFALPVLLGIFITPKPTKYPSFWTAMAWWLGLIWPIGLAALVGWLWRWWRDIPVHETDPTEPEQASRKAAHPLGRPRHDLARAPPRPVPV